MRKLITSLPQWAEIAVVAGLGFGLLGYISLDGALHPTTLAQASDSDFLFTAALQLGVLALVAPFLWARGWTWSRLGLVLGPIDIPIGVLLMAGAILVSLALFLVVAQFSPELAQRLGGPSQTHPGLHLDYAVIVPSIVLNGFFEELFETGYLVAALRRDDNPWFAANIAIAARLALYLYMGPAGVLNVLPMGVIFTAWFAYRGKLWPAIAGHVAMDLLVVLTYR